MPPIDEMTILRYFENDLEEDERQAVETALASDVEAQEKLEMLRQSADALSQAFGHLKDAASSSPTDTSLPANLRPPERSHPRPQVVHTSAAPARSEPFGFAEDSLPSRQDADANPRGARRTFSFVQAGLMAASLLVGIGVGRLTLHSSPTAEAVVLQPSGTAAPASNSTDIAKNDDRSLPSPGAVTDGVSFEDSAARYGAASPVPEAAPSAEIAPGPRDSRVLRTLTAPDGAVCRELEIPPAGGSSVQWTVLACKEPDENWSSARIFRNATGK